MKESSINTSVDKREKRELRKRRREVKLMVEGAAVWRGPMWSRGEALPCTGG
jgi:hypothetical protein